MTEESECRIITGEFYHGFFLQQVEGALVQKGA